MCFALFLNVFPCVFDVWEDVARDPLGGSMMDGMGKIVKTANQWSVACMAVAVLTHTHVFVTRGGMGICVTSHIARWSASMDFAMLHLVQTGPTTASVTQGGGVKLVISAVPTGNAPIR